MFIKLQLVEVFLQLVFQLEVFLLLLIQDLIQLLLVLMKG
jgi:hypothetical protein